MKSSTGDLSPQEKRTLLEELLKKKAAKSASADELGNAIRQLDRNAGLLPLSSAQNRILFLEEFEPGMAAYNIPAMVRLSGTLDIQALEASLDEIVKRHEPLRTNYRIEKGLGIQEISSNATLSLSITNVESLPESNKEHELERLMLEEAARPFDLGKDLKLRAFLLRLAAEDHILILTMHHISSDGWSLGILFKELEALYNAFASGRPSPLDENKVQYCDYVNWHQQWFQGDILEKQLVFWKRQLENLPAVLDLPLDKPRPAVQSYRGSRCSFHLSVELTNSIKAFCRREGVTLFMTLLAAYQTLLFRYTGQADIAIGTPVAGRSRAEVNSLIGLFINTIVLRSNLSGELTFIELLHRVQQVALNAYEHPDLPFEKLVEELHPARTLSYSPLFQIMFVLQNISLPVPKLEGMTTLSLMELPTGTSKFDLYLSMIETTDGLVGEIEYNTDLFVRSTIERMAEHFGVLLEDIVKEPSCRISELNYLTPKEQKQIFTEWNQTQIKVEPVCLHQMFASQVLRSKDTIAVTFENDRLTYWELNERANKLAHYLKALGVGPGTLVGIHLHRSVNMIVALLGILKAGGAYVPLDPSFPSERLALMASDSQLSILITQESLANQIPIPEQTAVVSIDRDWETISQESEQNPTEAVRIHDLAYVIYTSGSTGKPKGVQIEHRSVVNFLTSMQRHFALGKQDILLSVTTLSFDIAVLEIFLPLISGAQLRLASRETAEDAGQLLHELVTSNVSIMQATPTTWRMLIEAGWHGDKHLRVLCGGEALPFDLANQIAERCAELWNMYGPTETTIWSTMHHFERGEDEVLIGRPIGNTQCYILDSHKEPVAIGIPGELFIGGVGVARGYLNRPELTNEKFVADPFSSIPEARLYRTGDMVRFDQDGRIQFLSRIDNQVKIRGFRIELGEIESVLMRYPAIQQAVVIVREDTPGDKRLIAYLILHAGEQEPSTSDLRSFLGNVLPEYMIPSTYVCLDDFPLTPNKKIDRKALPAPDHARPVLASQYVAPRDDTESIITAIFASILKVERVGIYDSFFDLGGHSLLATQAISHIRQELEVELPLRTLFEYPTPIGLASYILQKKMQEMDNEKLGELLASVENMSEEQVKSLLSSED